MRLTAKTFLLISALFVVAIASFASLLVHQRSFLSSLLAERMNETESNLDRIIDLKGQGPKTLAFDYTFWDEMVDFVRSGDPLWARQNIETSAGSYRFDAVWVFNAGRENVYTYTKEDALAALTFPPELFALLTEKRLLHFYLPTPQGPLEIQAATIHPTADPDRITPPQGFFIVGRIWTKEYLSEIATLIDGKIELADAGAGSLREKSDPRLSRIVLFKTLSDYARRPVATLKIETTSRQIATFNRGATQTLIFIVVVALLIILILTSFITRAIIHPLSLMASALAQEKPDPLRPLLSKTNEIGSIARLIERSFVQRRELIEEVRERQKAQESLKKLSLALEQTADSVFITDRDAVIEYVNPSFEKLSGYSRSEAIGKTPAILKSGRHDAAFYMGMREVISAGKTFRNIVTNKKKDGTLFDVEKTITPIKNAQGTITHFVSIDKDVTTRREMEKAQRLTQLGKLVSDISHEINNPLQIISGRAELALLDPKDTALVHESLQVITDQCQRAKKIILRVLQFSKPTRHELKAVNIARATEDTLAIVESQFRLNGIAIIRNFAPDLPPILADEKQVQEVLMNLLTNARDAIKGTGRITLSACRTGQFVELKIKDTGTGMEEGTLAHAFEPFFTTKEKGTGLGLHICYNIVRVHDGEMKIESNVGLGTTVTLLWPIKT